MVERRQDAAQRYVVVVGASGVLAPLGDSLSGSRVRTVGVSRGARTGVGSWDVRAALDARDPHQVTTLVTRLGAGVRTVIAYEPAVSLESWRVLCGFSDRRVIVLPSRYADPDTGLEAVRPWLEPGGVVVVQLGWAGSSDSTRWHSPLEISDVTARALHVASGTTLHVGRVRPWSERPG